MPLPYLIFDLMDTIVVDPFFHYVPAFFHLSMAELMAVKDPHSWPAFERGEIDEASYFQQFFRADSGWQLQDPHAFKQGLFATYRYVAGMEELLTELSTRGAMMWVHSNYTSWVSEIRRRLNLDRFFQGYAMSFELKARKPEVEAYQAALAMMGRAASDCLLIDDRRENVNAARSIGMAALTFENAVELRQALLG